MKVWGYDFDMVADGMAVVAQARKNEGDYDLCLMDIDMPRMNGLTAAGIIRQKVRYFPILALSGDPRYREECLETGMDDFFGKALFSKGTFRKNQRINGKVFSI